MSLCASLLLLSSLAGCGGGGNSSSGTTGGGTTGSGTGSTGGGTGGSPNMTPMPVTIGGVTFETNSNLSAFSRTLSNNNSNFFTGASYSMTGYGARAGGTLSLSFANGTIDGVPTITMTENYGGGTVETYDLAVAENGAIFNLQAAGRTGDNFTTTGNSITPPIFLPATITPGATWTGGFTQSGGMSIISVNDTGPKSTIPGEIHVRQAAATGSVQLEFYLKVSWGFTDITANGNVDGYKTNLTGPG